MRIWYQSMTREDSWPFYLKTLARVLEESKDPGTEVEVHGIRNVGGMYDQFRYLDYLETAEVVENCQRAVREGFDAFIIGNIGEPGLHLCREVANIPVLGLCETSVHLACQMGANFSFVAINEKWEPRIRESVARYGLSGRLHSIRRMRIERMNDFEACVNDPQARRAIVNQFFEAARACVADGGEVVIPAGGVPMVLLHMEDEHEVAQGAPILNGITAVLKSTEAAVRLNRLMGGRFTSKRLSYAGPSVQQIAEVRKHYGAVYPLVQAPGDGKP